MRREFYDDQIGTVQSCTFIGASEVYFNWLQILAHHAYKPSCQS